MKRTTVKTMPRDWLPDWRDPKAYPDDDLTNQQWAWQFLRRNPEYQEVYARWRELFDNVGEHPTVEEDLRFFDCDPPARLGETFAAYHRRVGKKYKGHKSKIRIIGDRFGLKPFSLRLPDPREDRPRLRFSGSGVSIVPGIPGEKQFPGALVGPGEFEAFVKFDLQWPLEVQLRKAKKILESWRRSYERNKGFEPIKNRPRDHRLYRQYLRLLDGNANGAPNRDLAAVIFPNEKNESPEYRGNAKVRDSLKAAKRLRDGGYVFLPLIGK